MSQLFRKYLSISSEKAQFQLSSWRFIFPVDLSLYNISRKTFSFSDTIIMVFPCEKRLLYVALCRGQQQNRPSVRPSEIMTMRWQWKKGKWFFLFRLFFMFLQIIRKLNFGTNLNIGYQEDNIISHEFNKASKEDKRTFIFL